MLSNQRREQLKRKLPLIIFLAIAIAVCLFILLEIVEDVVIEGTPLTSIPYIGIILNLTQSITATVSSWGYIGIFVLMLFESSSLPIPSEVVLPFAGYFVSMGQLDFGLTIIVATIAAITGSLIDYYIGYKGVHILAKRKIIGAVFSMDQITIATKWFNKYGSFMVFIGRLVPVFRTLISFPAGAVKMPIGKFVAFTTLGCLVWNALLVYLGCFLGTNWNDVAGISHYIIIAVTVTAVAMLAVYFVNKRRIKRK